MADQRKASDLHLVVGFPPFLRVVGDIDPLIDVEPVQPEDARAALVDLTTPEEREEFYRTLELDSATMSLVLGESATLPSRGAA